LDALARKLADKGMLSIEDLPWPRQMRILVLAPHPDDFDAIAITLRFFHERGDSVRLCILSSSASGVEDSFAGQPSAAVKAAIRESEQQTRGYGFDERILRVNRQAAAEIHGKDCYAEVFEVRNHLET
jgi:hypothetical protein